MQKYLRKTPLFSERICSSIMLLKQQNNEFPHQKVIFENNLVMLSYLALSGFVNY